MKHVRLLFLLLLAVTFASVPAYAGILDLLWGSTSEVDGVSSSNGGEAERGESPPRRNCSCVASECNCCAALDFAYVDLGGPGCVSMRYKSPTEGIALNISYGDSLLLSDAIKGSRPAPSCLDLLSDLAQLCARVGQLRATADGLRWCVWLEPRLLGDPQAAYGLGCFRMGPEGMSPDAFTPEDNAGPPPIPASSTDAAAATTPSPPAEDVNEEELIAAVNQSAEDGIAFFSNLLGLTFGGASQGEATGANVTEATTDSDAAATTEAPAAEEASVRK